MNVMDWILYIMFWGSILLGNGYTYDLRNGTFTKGNETVIVSPYATDKSYETRFSQK